MTVDGGGLVAVKIQDSWFIPFPSPQQPQPQLSPGGCVGSDLMRHFYLLLLSDSLFGDHFPTCHLASFVPFTFIPFLPHAFAFETHASPSPSPGLHFDTSLHMPLSSFISLHATSFPHLPLPHLSSHLTIHFLCLMLHTHLYSYCPFLSLSFPLIYLCPFTPPFHSLPFPSATPFLFGVSCHVWTFDVSWVERLVDFIICGGGWVVLIFVPHPPRIPHFWELFFSAFSFTHATSSLCTTFTTTRPSPPFRSHTFHTHATHTGIYYVPPLSFLAFSSFMKNHPSSIHYSILTTGPISANDICERRRQ